MNYQKKNKRDMKRIYRRRERKDEKSFLLNDDEFDTFKRILQKSSQSFEHSPSMSFTPNIMRMIDKANIKIGWVGWTKRSASLCSTELQGPVFFF